MRILHFILILAFAILISSFLKPKAPPKVISYLLAVTWPPGACTGKSGINCKIKPVPTEFTIHGLWPQPNGLQSNETFDANKLATLASELSKNWPNLESEQQQISVNIKFWLAEWIKHGRYSEMGVHEYFQKTLELFRNVGQGLKGNLDAQGIKPTLYAYYKLVDIEAALQKIFGVTCTVICVQRASSNVMQIQEIRFSFTKNFNLQNNRTPSNCGTGDVLFPLMQ